MTLIELNAPRVVVLRDRGNEYKLTVARIRAAQWLKYFDGIESTSENANGKRVDRFDSSSARLQLATESLCDAQGYATAENRPISSIERWKELISTAHRLSLGSVLTDVRRSEAQASSAILLGTETVYLDAVWSANERGEMCEVRGLVHRFRTPTAEQHRRFSRDSARSTITGNSRKAVTRWMGAQATLAELYDELVQSVEGYTVEGVPLGENRAAIAAEMDVYHKVAAADALFSPGTADLKDEDNK